MFRNRDILLPITIGFTTMTQEPDHKDRFFKYVSASTAIKILERSTVRYSSPLIFNDPFDVQSGLHFPFDITALHEKALGRIRSLATAETRPEVDETDDWGKSIIVMWENRHKKGIPESFLRSMLAPLKDRIVLYQKQCQYLWRIEFLPRLRVFSVTEDPENILMWSHYANNHTGAVFAF